MLKLALVLGLVALGWLLLVRTRRPQAAPGLSVEEARAILGVGPEADADTIRLAHRRLIAQVHPDAGGTAELTRRVNLARDVALAALAPPAPGC